MPMEVHKFGGTSLADATCIRRCADLLVKARLRGAVVGVTSAVGGLTDELLSAAAAASKGNRDGCRQAADAIRKRHQQILADLSVSDAESVDGELAALHDQFTRQLEGVLAVGELTERTRDAIVSLGEKSAARLTAAAVRSLGKKARAIDADTFLETDGCHGEAMPLHGVAERTMEATLRPLLEAGNILVTTGFLGQAPDGSTTTLGRGGSDYSATLIAGALSADQVVIWTDVDGIYTSDPRIAPEARSVPQMNFREAAELSFYGAKVLHQRSIIPVASRGIPVIVRSSMQPDLPGTRVDGQFTRGSHPVKAIGAVRGQALVSVEGKGMAGVPGIAARVFGALAAESISVTMICQSSSESTICLAIPGNEALRAEIALKREFHTDLSHGDVEEILVQRRVSLLAAVGLGMAHTVGVAARVCQSLAQRRINILALAQGSSELNISLAVDEKDTDAAVRGIHDEFDLQRLDTGEDTTRRFDLMILGLGSIGRALAELLQERSEHIQRRFGLNVRLVAVCDRKAFLFHPRGLPEETFQAALRCKADGRSLTEVEGAVASDDPAEMLRHAAQYRLARPVLIDTSDSKTNHGIFLDAMRAGFDVVTANKNPLAGSMESYQQLWQVAHDHRRMLKAEATVGAGLPTIDSMENLLSAGDPLLKIEGCLSGTLSYLLDQVSQGQPFSEALREAARVGYTEPDPMVDVSGGDVARKGLILGRWSGLLDGTETVQHEGLIGEVGPWKTMDELVAQLRVFDEPLAQRFRRAKENGLALRFVARVEPSKVFIGPTEVPLESPLGSLQGTDNMMVFTTQRYHEQPLAITGPGAGVDVTAAGVLSDVLRIAAERS